MSNKYNSKVPWPRDNFILRCTSNEFTQSKTSGNPMIVLEFEVVTPAEYEIGPEVYTLAGEKISLYFPTMTMYVNEDGQRVAHAEKSKANSDRLKDLYEKFGLDFNGFDPSNPVLEFKGRNVWVMMYDKASEQCKSPTSDQLKAGLTKGEVIKNPITGLAMVRHEPAVSEVYGLAPN